MQIQKDLKHSKSLKTKIMKKIITLVFVLLFASTISAQAPQKMSYQAVIRNTGNNLVVNANVGVRVSLLQTSATGTVVFSEYHTPTTNANGLVTLEIGGGTMLTGNFATINWANGPYFIKTETDPTGPGTNYTISGTSQLLSVPFALYAASSGSSASNWTATGPNIANNNTGNVGIGTGATIPSSLLTVKIEGLGFTQEDATGATKIGFYTDANAGYIQTHSNNDLSFATNNGAARMTLQKTTGNFGINTTNPTEKLEVAGKTKTTNLQVVAGASAGKVLTSDAAGNATWQTATSANSWSTTGNAGTNASTNFIGTTDNVDVVFKRNNNLAGSLSIDNTSLGLFALNSITTGNQNTAIGDSALRDTTTGSSNTAIGDSALILNTTGANNTATGRSALLFNSTGYENTATGSTALYTNSTGTQNTADGAYALQRNTTGSSNTASGNSSLNQNTTGNFNTAAGYQSLRDNTIGAYNTASGSYALNKNIDGNYNTAMGSQSLKANTTGSFNSAIGNQALYTNTTGSANTAMGHNALESNSTGSFSTATGDNALFSNTSGDQNTAFGYQALNQNTTGYQNTAVGWTAGSNMTTGNNNAVFGAAAQVPSATGSNQIRIGNTSVTYIGGQVAWSFSSDRRFKNTIEPSKLGLDFIKKLNPVSYLRNNDESKKVEYGFIAQELEAILNDSGAANNGIITKDDAGVYSVRYNDLISISVKAIQELETENLTLKSQIQALEKSNNEILKRLEQLEKN